MTLDTTVNGNGTAMAVRETTDLGLHFVVSLDELRLQLRELEEFKRAIMVENVDYGTIPGTPKPTLLKPGAEKLALAFGLAPTFVSANRVEDWERGFFHYEERCNLVNKRTGEIIGCASGSANSKEPRYRWRDAKPACLNCGRDLRRSRNRDGEPGEPGWYCWTKTGGCGATFPAAQITGPIGRVENPEPYELTNTILKMAQKRALVAAVLIATGGSGIWTQDVEDLPGDAPGVVDVPLRDEQERPRSYRQSAARQPARATGAALKTTDTQCSVCTKKVETQRVVGDSVKQFGVAFCIEHMNDALKTAAEARRGSDEDPF